MRFTCFLDVTGRSVHDAVRAPAAPVRHPAIRVTLAVGTLTNPVRYANGGLA